MTTTDDQYVPTEGEMRHAYWLTRMLDHHAAVDAAFDRFLDRVRRDAARSAMEGLAADFDMWHQDMPTDEVARRIRHEMELLHPEEETP